MRNIVPNTGAVSHFSRLREVERQQAILLFAAFRSHFSRLREVESDCQKTMAWYDRHTSHACVRLKGVSSLL